MIFRDLRPGLGHDRKQGGLAYRWKAHQSDVGEHLQLDLDVKLFAWLPHLAVLRRGVLARFEMEIAASAFAASGDHGLLPRLGQVGDHMSALQVLDDRSLRDLDHIIFSVGAVHLLRLAIAAGLGLHLLVVAQIEQRRLSGIHPEDHTAAISAVSAIRAAIGDIFLPAECHDAIAAFAGLDMYLDSVDKHAFTSSKIKSP